MTLALIFCSLLAAAVWEFIRPRRQREFPALRRRLGNLGIWMFNILAAAVVFPIQPQLVDWPIANPALGFAAAFLALDLLSYGVHRAQHAVPLLWRFHALHHSDPDVDSTTSVRHHPVEFLLATGAFWAAVILLGIPIAAAATHATAVFVLALATHANARWPAWLGRLLQPLVITLDLHLVHHSTAPSELNTNFGAVLSVWDRLFSTLRQLPREHVDQLTFGVEGLSRPDACRPIPMLLTPWRFK